MQGVLLGFGIVLIIVLVGYGAARILKDQAAHMLKGLAPTVYYITNPALMMMLVADTDLHAVLGVFTPIALITAALSGGLYAVVSRFLLHRDGQRTAVGAMSASYVNAGNIGLPIAVYAIGSSAPVVSVLLAQLLVIAPLYLALFTWLSERHDGGSRGLGASRSGIGGGRPAQDASGGSGGVRLAVQAVPVTVRRSAWRMVLGTVANPVTVGTAVGLLLAVTGFRPPQVLWTPITMLGNASVPMLLLMFGMSLGGGRASGQPGLRTDVGWASGIKLVAMPLIGWAVAHFVFGLGGVQLLGVV
ncbi:MAG TPA: AEC family transporter, partial [Arthrobacter sp.]|nr:AEC family transporter [Arthrobacter sp.]